VVVVSWHYWKTRLYGDPAAIGKRIWVESVPKTIIGVAPRAYVGPRVGVQTDVWMPRERDAVTLIGRLKPGISIAQARAEAPVLFRFTTELRASRSKDPLVRQITVELEPIGKGLVRVRDQYGKPLALLMTIVGVLLLLACINLASMLLARSAGRQRELAMRVGLGAGRGGLVMQMLTESVLLSTAGSALGVILAWFGTRVLVRIMASGRAHERVDLQVEPDLHVLLFTLGIAVLTGLLFGLAPAWYAFRSAPSISLRQAGRGGGTWFWRMFGRGLVTAQVALSILLVTSAGMFLAHLSRLRNFDLGFRSDHVLLVTLDPAHSGYRREQLATPYQEVLRKMQSIPGVRSVSISGCTPIQGCGASRFVIAEGYIERPEDRRYTALSWVAPGYFATLGIPLVGGRDFSFADAGRARVAIINESLARHYFAGVNPIGKHVGIDRDPRTGGWYGSDEPYEIIGVAGDAKYTELRETPPRGMYFNMFQESRIANQFELRTAIDPESIAAAVRRVVREVVPAVPITRVTTLADQVDAAIVPERLIATLSTYFGVLAAVLAAIGLYGLLAYTVARRTGEIGIRMALGATSGHVTGLVLFEALEMTAAGLFAGIALVFGSRPLVASLLQDLRPAGFGPMVLGGGIILGIALVASCVPVLRALRVDPMVALRHE
jgi:predicted permease